MDYVNLVVKVDLSQVKAADDAISELGTTVDKTSKSMDSMGSRGARNLGNELNSLRNGLAQTEGLATSLAGSFEKLGSLGGGIGATASHFANLFKVISSSASAQKELNNESLNTHRIMSGSNDLLSVQNGLLVANAASMLKVASASKTMTAGEIAEARGGGFLDAFAQPRTAAEYLKIQTAYKRELRANKAVDFFGDQIQTNPNFERIFTQATEEVNNLKKAAAEAETTFAGLAMKGGLIIGAIAGIAAIAGTAFGLLSTSAREAADAQDELAQKLGVSRERLVTLQLIASENGASVEGLIKTYDKLSKSMNKMDEDNTKTTYAFESLGISLDSIKNKKPEEVAGLIISNYEKIGQTSKATAAVIQLLGPNFRDQSIAIKEASEKMSEYEERVKTFGGVVSEAVIAQGARQEQALSNLKNSWTTLKDNIAQLTSEMSTSIAVWAANTITHINNVIAKAAATPRSIDLYGAIPPDVRRSIQSKVADEQSAGKIAAGKDAFKARVKELYEQELVLIRRTDEALNDRDTTELTRLNNLSRVKQKQEEDRLKALSAAAKLKGPDEDLEKGALREAQRIAKERQDARIKEDLGIQEWLTKGIFEWEEKAQKKREDALKSIQQQREETQKYYELLQNISKMGANTIFGSLSRSGTLSPIEIARKERDDRLNEISKTSGTERQKLIDQYELQMLRKEGDAAAETARRIQELGDATDTALGNISSAYSRAAEEAQSFSITSKESWDAIKTGAQNFFNTIPTLKNLMMDFTQNALQEFSDTLVNTFITGRFEAEQFGKSILTMLLRIQAQMLTMKIYGAVVGVSGAGSGSIAMANGGAFNNGIQMFANGGIVNQPTLFRTSTGMGLMGEAGSEAIMPLRRTSSGRLGVEVVGSQSSSGINIGSINVTVQGGNTNAETGNAVAEAIISRIADARIQNATRSGGIIRQAFA